jgi:DNA-binding LytR/AlgR family response regulator
MKVLIVEDEPLGAQTLKDCLEQVDDTIVVMALCNSIRSTIMFLSSGAEPDLIFMDIELADGQCFEKFKETEVRCPVIFTTTYDEYALKAFQHNGLDYLLKPIHPDELRRSLDKLNSFKKQLIGPGLQEKWEPLLKYVNDVPRHSEYRERFLIKQGQRYFSVSVPDIAYFYAKAKVAAARLVNGKEHLLDYTLDELEPMLSPKSFYRLNRQVIASHSAILQIHTWFNGKLKVTLIPALDDDVVVSREKAKEFRKWMGE